MTALDSALGLGSPDAFGEPPGISIVCSGNRNSVGGQEAFSENCCGVLVLGRALLCANRYPVPGYGRCEGFAFKVTGQVSWHPKTGADVTVRMVCEPHTELTNFSSKRQLRLMKSPSIYSRAMAEESMRSSKMTASLLKPPSAPGPQNPLDHNCASAAWSSDQWQRPIEPREQDRRSCLPSSVMAPPMGRVTGVRI